MASERWAYVTDDGKIVLHTENDGAAFMTRGPEEKDEEITLGELFYCHSRSHGKEMWVEVMEDLKKKGFPVPAIEKPVWMIKECAK